MASLKTIMENMVHEDEDARRKGWKHIAFGTWEDQSGNRYKKDDMGAWQPVGGADTASPAPQQAAQPQAKAPIDRSQLNKLTDPKAREEVGALLDVAELPDEELQYAIHDGRMKDTRDEIASSLAYGREATPHLEKLRDAFRQTAIQFSEDDPFGDGRRKYDEDEVAAMWGNGEIELGTEDLGAVRDAIVGHAMGSLPTDTDTAATDAHAEYEERVTGLEGEGMTRSDAQGIADMEFDKKYGRGWERSSLKEILRTAVHKIIREELRRYR